MRFVTVFDGMITVRDIGQLARALSTAYAHGDNEPIWDSLYALIGTELVKVQVTLIGVSDFDDFDYASARYAVSRADSGEVINTIVHSVDGRA